MLVFVCKRQFVSCEVVPAFADQPSAIHEPAVLAGLLVRQAFFLERRDKHVGGTNPGFACAQEQ